MHGRGGEGAHVLVVFYGSMANMALVLLGVPKEDVNNMLSQGSDESCMSLASTGSSAVNMGEVNIFVMFDVV